MERTQVESTREFCRRCGSLLKGYLQNMGICHSCVFETARKGRKKVKIPLYSFTEEED